MFSLRIKYAIQLLSELRRYNGRGVRPSSSNLRERCGFEKGGDQLRVMAQLRHSGWVSFDNRCYNIAVDLSQKTLYDLMVAMNEEVRIGPSPVIDWPLKSRSLCDPAIVLERELQAAFEQQLKTYSMADLTGVTDPATNKAKTTAVTENNVRHKKTVRINDGINLSDRTNIK